MATIEFCPKCGDDLVLPCQDKIGWFRCLECRHLWKPSERGLTLRRTQISCLQTLYKMSQRQVYRLVERLGHIEISMVTGLDRHGRSPRILIMQVWVDKHGAGYRSPTKKPVLQVSLGNWQWATQPLPDGKLPEPLPFRYMDNEVLADFPEIAECIIDYYPPRGVQTLPLPYGTKHLEIDGPVREVRLGMKHPYLTVDISELTPMPYQVRCFFDKKRATWFWPLFLCSPSTCDGFRWLSVP